MSAYKPAFIYSPTGSGNEELPILSPTSFDLIEPMMSEGEFVFSGPDNDIMMGYSSTITLSVVAPG